MASSTNVDSNNRLVRLEKLVKGLTDTVQKLTTSSNAAFAQQAFVITVENLVTTIRWESAFLGHIFSLMVQHIRTFNSNDLMTRHIYSSMSQF